MYSRINEQNFCNLKLPRESCLVNFSSFQELHTDSLFRSFSIKFVLEGCETYQIDGQKFEVVPSQFLLANHFSRGITRIQSKTLVHGICIDVSPSLINEAYTAILHPELTMKDDIVENYFTSEQFVENKYLTSQSTLGQKLDLIGKEILTHTNHEFEFSNEFYFSLAESLVKDFHDQGKQMASMNCSKLFTKKDLLRKLLEAKQYIDEHYASIQSIAEVAQMVYMSEFHFYRLYRLVFNQSPHQYLIKRRMSAAVEHIKKYNSNITEVALMVGYQDLASFSKVFKKWHGVSPGKFLARKTK